MKMIVTLRSGVQIRTDVEEFRIGKSPLQGQLRELNWKWPAGSQMVLKWVDLAEIAAVHIENEPGDEDVKPGEAPSA